MAQQGQKAPVKADGIPVYCSHNVIMQTSDLAPNPRNPNTHPENQIKLLAKVIAVQGWRHPIVVSSRSKMIVKGHGRRMAALHLGLTEVPVDVQFYATEEEEHADMLADNRLAELAELDTTILKDLIAELDTGAIDLDLTGFDSSALEGLMTSTPPPDDAPRTIKVKFSTDEGVDEFSQLVGKDITDQTRSIDYP